MPDLLENLCPIIRSHFRETRILKKLIGQACRCHTRSAPLRNHDAVRLQPSMLAVDNRRRSLSAGTMTPPGSTHRRPRLITAAAPSEPPIEPTISETHTSTSSGNCTCVE